eukprot:jgi/Mesvir1/5397/Mv15470-RA.2
MQRFTHNLLSSHDLMVEFWVSPSGGTGQRRAHAPRRSHGCTGSCDTDVLAYHRLLRITREISGQRDINGAIARIVASTYRVLNADRVSFFLVDPHSDELLLYVSKDAPGVRIPSGQGLVGSVVTTGALLNIPDAYKDDRFSELLDEATGYCTKSVLGMPVRDPSGKVVAVIQAINKLEDDGPVPPPNPARWYAHDGSGDDDDDDGEGCAPPPPAVMRTPSRLSRLRMASNLGSAPKRIGVFTAKDEFLLRAIADFAGSVLTTLRGMEAQMVARKKADAIVDLLKAVVGTEDIKSLLLRLSNAMRSFFAVDAVSIFMVDQVQQEIWLFDPGKVDHAAGFKIGRGIAGYVAKNDVLVTSSRVAQDARFDPAVDELGLNSCSDTSRSPSLAKSILCAPVRSRAGDVLAVVSAVNKRAVMRNPDCSVSNTPVRREGSSPFHPPGTFQFGSCPEFHLGRTSGDGGEPSSPLVLASPPSTVSAIVPFETQDEEVMVAVCAELGHILLRKGLEAAYTRLVYPVDLSSHPELARHHHHRPQQGEIDRSFAEMYSRGVCPSPSSFSRRSVEHMRRLHEASWEPMLACPRVDDKEALLRDVNYDLDVLSLSPAQLFVLAERMFAHFGLLDHFGIGREPLRAFLAAVHARYRNLPYHNFTHAFSVMHMAFFILLKTRAAMFLSKLEILALFISCIGHDIDHPGHNNSYEVKSQSEKALLYNDISVLENHHIAVLWTLFKDPQTNIIRNLSPEDYAEFRRAAIATPDEAFGSDSEFLLQTILHAADLSGQVMPKHLAAAWGERAIAEFRNQAELEEAKGLPVAASMANLDSDVLVARVQMSFVRYVVLPFWSALALAFPELKPQLDNLNERSAEYERKAREGDSSEGEEEDSFEGEEEDMYSP